MPHPRGSKRPPIRGLARKLDSHMVPRVYNLVSQALECKREFARVTLGASY